MTVNTMSKVCIGLDVATIVLGQVAKKTGNPVVATIALTAYLTQIPVIALAVIDLNKAMKQN